MAKQGSIAIPTGSNISKSVSNYGVGLVAGIGFDLINRLLANFGIGGGGLISGGIAAGLTGAVVPGEAGKIVTTTLGFNVGSRGLGNLLGGVGGGIGGLIGGGAQGAAAQQSSGPQFDLI